MNLPQFKKACWAVYFYRNQYFLIQCKNYNEATEWISSLKEKPAVDPLGIYRYKEDKFFWKLRNSLTMESLRASHRPFVLQEIEKLKTQLNTI